MALLQQLRSRLGRDLLWNLLSFAVLGICGILLNLVIAQAYGAVTLGVFNQALTIYIFGSQFCALGVHFSVLSQLPARAADAQTRAELAAAALLVTLVLSFAVCALAYAAAPLVGPAFDSEQVAIAYLDILPAIGLFALNKTLLNALNAMRHTRAFALTQASRPALMVMGLIALAAFGVPGSRVCLAVTAAEAVVFVILLLLVAGSIGLRLAAGTVEWMGRHLSFGSRTFMSGALAEMNSRLDVLILGLFASDRVVGIYSFASMLAEGLAQFAAVVKNSINPLIAEHYFHQRKETLQVLLHATVRRFYGVMALGCALAIAAFPLVLLMVSGDQDFQGSWPIFAVLAAFIAAVGGYLPLDLLFNQCGHGGLQTLLKFLTFMATLVLCLAVAPLGSPLAFAVAVGLSACVGVVALKLIARTRLGISI